eukprot:64517_1
MAGSLQSEYFHVLKIMDPCGQSDIIDRYIEEAKDYQTKTALELEQFEDTNRDKLRTIEDKMIELLEEILNDAETPFDVAFCRLIIILPYVHTGPFAVEFIAFFFYFMLGSCFPSVRKHIRMEIVDPQSRMLRYLIGTYFTNLNDKRCIQFKYCGQQSTHALSSALEEYVSNPFVSIICDYVQYPNQEFVHFLNNFLWHFPLHRHLQTCTAQCIHFIHHCDNAGEYLNESDITRGHLLSRLLVGKYFLNHKDARLKYEAHRMALSKLKTNEEISWYFNQKINRSIQCHVNPKSFLELFECAVSNPWHVMRDAILNHSLSIFCNGNKEQSVVTTVSTAVGTIWCKQMMTCLHYIFKNVIPRFDTNDLTLAAQLVWQFGNCRCYCLRLPVECEAKNELMAVVRQYYFSYYFEPVVEQTRQLYQNTMAIINANKAPPRKKQRLNH